MAKKVFTEESLETLVNETKTYVNDVASGKSDKGHTHAIDDVTNLQDTLDSKSNTGHTHIVANITDLTATATELNYMDGVTSNVQTQLNGKAATSHTHTVSEVSDLTATATELNYVGGVTSAIQTQIDDVKDELALNAGKIVTGQTFTLEDETSVTAETGAEIFNDYTNNIASGEYSHAEGSNSEASGYSSHAEGSLTTASGSYSHAEGIHSIASGIVSHAEGYYTTASGNYSHAEGYWNSAKGEASHAEGNASASGDYSHAEGYYSIASGNYSHAENQRAEASGIASHAEGYCTTASGNYSHAEGFTTTALTGQHAQGHFNDTSLAVAGASTGTTGTAFVIGNGTSTSASNAFRVTYVGKPYAKSSITTTGCDYAEFFEWQDQNPNSEDRRGYFVTIDGEYIKIAKPNDYILGIVSGQPSVVGNGDEDWMGRYVFDEFGAFVYENFEYEEEVTNKETGEKETVVKVGQKYKENPDYDPTIPYIQREDRPEWDTVGMLGVLSVRDDGTCSVNGYCTVAEGGIATASEAGYRVIKRVSENIVRVIFR